jgi:hypothetical protein
MERGGTGDRRGEPPKDMEDRGPSDDDVAERDLVLARKARTEERKKAYTGQVTSMYVSGEYVVLLIIIYLIPEYLR